MTLLNLLSALFIMTVMYCLGKPRIQLPLAIAAALATPVGLGATGGLEGLAFSLFGASLALLFTMPLSLFGRISRTDVLVSVALAGMLGAVQYALVFGISILFLLVQRLLRIDSAPTPVISERPNAEGAGMLTLGEQSALVEIEAMKILHKDKKEFEELARREGYPGFSSDAPAAPPFLFPWPAKLAVATLAVLMIGSSL
jgi:hypothetical protein